MAVNPADSSVHGGLFGTDAMRAVWDERGLVARLLAVEAALARAQAGLGLIPSSAAEGIAEVARVEAIDLAALGRSTATVGYPVVGLVRQLSQLSGPHAGRFVHWGATTQDILDTALVLQLRDSLALLEDDLRRAVTALASRAAEHRDTVMAGRTHLQHALPVTFGYKVAVWLDPLVTHLRRVVELRQRVLVVQFGGAVGTLASLGTEGRRVTEALAAALGLGVPDAPWHVARDRPVEAASWMAMLCGLLGKIATDVMLLMQTEVGEVFEPHQAGRGGSSTMPQKRNPIACEYILAAGRGAHALLPLLYGAMAGDQERATGPWQAEPLALPQIATLTGGALAQACALAEGMTVDAARMRRNLDLTNGLILAEAAMMGLADDLGREEAHHVVEAASAEAIEGGLSLAETLGWHLGGKADPALLARLTDPAGYLGEAGAVVDRVLARVRALGP